jgi:SAM-dependent methyltransferase
MDHADKKAKALAAIDPPSSRGIEIGALDNPLVTADMGSIFYADHELTPGLRAKYAEDPAVEIENIVEVDFQLGEASLAQTISAHADFDYVIASHIVEHVPDVVTWFREIAEVLRPGGVLSLVIPDKRFTFDYLRAPSTPSELIEAHYLGLRRPSFRQVFDSLASAVKVDVVEAWAARLPPDQLEHLYTEDFAFEHALKASDEYIDAHCWVFTPQSFFDAVRVLIRRDRFDYKVVSFFPTEHSDLQFFVALEKIAPDLDRPKRVRLQEGSIPLPRGDGPGFELTAAEQLYERVVEAGRENAALEQRIAELHSSRSWRVTAPLRWLASRFRRG